MKKSFRFLLAVALSVAVIASCTKETEESEKPGTEQETPDNQEPENPEPENPEPENPEPENPEPENPEPEVPEKTAPVISISAPTEVAPFELDWNNQDNTALSFIWTGDDAEAEYSLLFSAAEDMSDAKKIEAGKAFTKDLTHLELDAVLEELGVAAYKKGTAYWAVEGTNEIGTSTVAGGVLTMWRVCKPFVDPRDNEEYRICRIINHESGEYAVWFADNLRTMKYTDGTVLNEGQGKLNNDNPEMTAIYGGYYTWEATMGGTTGAADGEKIQGIAPTGWHIPTKAEWDWLINNCGDNSKPGIVLKNKDYWTAADGKPGTNSIGFNLAGAGSSYRYISNPFTEVSTNAYLWTATKSDEVNAYAYTFASNDWGHEAGSWPYNTTWYHTFSVRCVLD